MCERQIKAEGETIYCFMIILTDALFRTHGPNHSLVEGLIQYLPVHIDTIIML